MPLYGANASGSLRNQIRSPKALVGAGVALPTPISGMVARWDAYSGITADTTNGGFKWAPETGTQVLQSATATANTGPDYSATALSGRPAMLLSTNKSLRPSPDIQLNTSPFYLIFAFQMSAPSTSAVLFCGTQGSMLLRIVADGSVSIERKDQANIALAAAGAVPFDVPVVLVYEYSNGGTPKHLLRVNKVAKALTGDTVSGQYAASGNSILIGRQYTASAATDAVAALSYFELGLSFPLGTAITNPEAAIYQRWVA